MAERVLKHDKIDILWNTVVEAILGEDKGESSKVCAVRLKSVQTNQNQDLACQAVFIAIGHIPNTQPFQKDLKLDEASLFAADLFRMYQRYAEHAQLRVELLGVSSSEAGGIKEVSFLISGEDVYKALKYESGVHRVQRIPVTEASGRIHTSTVTVAVLPEAQEVDIAIDPKDLEISVCRASGPGGQGVNTTDSAVQILHKPTGMIVQCADERSQLKNKNKALTVLRARLLKQKQEEEQAKYAAHRRNQVGTGDRSERIRTYNFPQGRLTDHRIQFTTHNLLEVLDGKLDEILLALQKADQEKRLQELVGTE